jgi:hypothetical protein
MKRLRSWLSKIALILPIVLIAAGISLVSQSCPPKFRTDASTQVLYYVDSTDDDAYIYAASAYDWETAHDAASGTMDASNALIQVGISNNYSGSGVWRVWRGFHVFETSGIPDGCVITSATFHFYVDELQDTVTNYQKVYLVGDGITYPSEPIVATDFYYGNYYNYYGASKFVDNGVPADSLVVDDWNTISLNTEGIASINKVGNTPFCTQVTWDYLDFQPADGQRCYVDYGSADGANPPYLEVWYSTLPTVTSQAATSVSFSTATANGNITDTGYDNNDDRGCVYATSSHGDPAGVPPESSGYTYHTHDPGSWGTGAFTAALSSLSEDQVYYYRMWTHNPVTGYDYSDVQQSFHTLQIPTITTSAATSIMNTTARLPGDVTDAGWPASDTVVVYWGDNDGITTPGNWDYSGAPTSPAQPQGLAAFYKDVTGLSPGGTYYFRATVTNTSGTAWASATRSWSSTNIPPTVTASTGAGVTNVSAILYGAISSCGGDLTCSNYGFVWDTTSRPVDPGNTDPSATAYTNYWKAGSGMGVGNFQHSITVVPRTVYYFRSCAQNSSGWVYSPNPELSFTTCDHPDVTTSAPSGVTGTSATFMMMLDSIWGSNTTEWGFDYATDVYYTGHGSTYDLNTHLNSSEPPGWLSIPVLTLTPGTKYHYRAYATNAYGTGYGSDTHFGTIPEDPTLLTPGAMSYTTVDLTWTAGAHAAKTMIRYETASTTGDFPTGPDQGTEAYFNSDEACTVDSLTPGETYYIAAWSWIDGSDVWSSGYSTVVVPLSIPPPVSLKAVPDDATTINLWWIVPIGMRSVSTVTTILYGCVGTYPADPPNPPNPNDILIYTEITGDAGVKDYTWETATAGTPYFFSVWFYDSFTDTYTSAVSALCTTPAGFGDPSMPGGGSFNPPTDAAMTGVPIHSVVENLADVAGMDHGFYWGLLALLVGIIATMGAIIATKSGLMGTGVGGLILAVANTQDIVAVWVTIAFVFLGIVLSWVASHVYA